MEGTRREHVNRLIGEIARLPDDTIHPGTFFALQDEVQRDPDTPVLPLASYAKAKGASCEEIYRMVRRP